MELDGIEIAAEHEKLAHTADCVVIITDHSAVDYPRLARNASLIVDTRNALRGIDSANIVRL
jgi:UDP-N-acetyl-D-glucosamine dehydrogenase